MAESLNVGRCLGGKLARRNTRTDWHEEQANVAVPGPGLAGLDTEVRTCGSSGRDTAERPADRLPNKGVHPTGAGATVRAGG